VARAGRWAVWGLVLLLVAYMAWDLVFSDHGYRVYRSEQRHAEQLRKQVDEMRAQRERLAREILRLRHDPRALEELVHRELGYVYPDEYMLIMPDGQGSGVRGQGPGIRGQGPGIMEQRGGAE